MKISNKLNTADFIKLQKIMLEDFAPSMTLTFMLKYLVNFLYALVVTLGLYFILKRFSNMDNLLIPAIVGLITFALLIYFYPKIYRGRLNRTIERFYTKTELNLDRELELDDEGFTATDKNGEKRFSWTSFERIVRSSGNYFLKLKGQSEGFIIKADQLSPAEIAQLEAYLAKSGTAAEDRSHE